jgi:uncharacterized protein with HEPN domain
VSEDQPYLQHIVDAITQIEEYVTVGRDRFVTEHHWQDSVIFQLIIIGEATKHLSADLRVRHPEVAWRSMAAMRDVLVHNYMGIDLNVVWDVAVRMLPEVKRGVESILDEESRG